MIRAMDEAESEPRGISPSGVSLAEEQTLTALPTSMGTPTLVGSHRGAKGHSGGLVDPTRIGDYVVLHRLGQGGMGIIYAAYDERLDRKIAIKVLRASSRDHARFEREAKSLARLNHPNIVHIYETGSFEGAPYIAMEFVDGVTLGEWLHEQPRTLDAILAVFLEAGRGLAAAHAKKLVHRDFKPANVMVRRDGRVLVMDFGLARGDDDDTEDGELPVVGDDPSALASPSSPSTESLTLTGAVMGTPAYMAPEQFAGAQTDGATDQFSFCVCLWQAVHGERPFGGDSMAELAVSVSNGELRAPTRREVPAWLNQVMTRGLSLSPSDRWPSMQAVIDVLEADPGKRRRRVAAAVGLVVCVGLGAGVFAASQARERDALAAQCRAESRAIAEDWNPSVRSEAAVAFEASGPSYANDSFARGAVWMDQYAEHWTRLRLAACRDHRLAETLDGASYSATRACLDEQRETFAVLARSWTHANPHVVAKAVRAAAELPPLERCTDARWLSLREVPPADEATRAKVEVLRDELESADAQARTGERAAALATLDQTLVAARELGWDPLVAQVQLERGELLRDLAEFDEARASYEDAFVAAGRAGDDLRALEAASDMTALLGMLLAEFDQGRHWARLAGMLLDRMDLRGAIQEAGLLNSLGAIQAQTGEPEAALESFTRALEIYGDQLGEQHPSTAKALGNLAVVHLGMEDLDAAIEAQARALAIREVTLGSQHPDVAHSVFNLGLAVQQAGDASRALELFERALEIRELVHGPEHPEVAAIVHAIAGAHERAGELDEALTGFERALAITTATLDPEHPEVAAAREAVERVRAARIAAGTPAGEESLEPPVE